MSDLQISSDLQIPSDLAISSDLQIPSDELVISSDLQLASSDLSTLRDLDAFSVSQDLLSNLNDLRPPEDLSTLNDLQVDFQVDLLSNLNNLQTDNIEDLKIDSLSISDPLSDLQTNQNLLESLSQSAPQLSSHEDPSNFLGNYFPAKIFLTARSFQEKKTQLTDVPFYPPRRRNKF